MQKELLHMLIQILDDMDLEKQNSQEAWDIVIDFFRAHSLLHTQEAEDMLQVAMEASSLHDNFHFLIWEQINQQKDSDPHHKC